MGLKALIPGTTASARRGHQAYLQRKVRGHDMLLQVQWADRTMTELAADYRPEDNKLIATNGLRFHIAGRGAEPFMWYGVPTVRVHALTPCPYDATSCIHADLDEENEYEVVVSDDAGAEVIRYTPEPDQESTLGSAAASAAKKVRGDGGEDDQATGPRVEEIDDDATVADVQHRVDEGDGKATDGGVAVAEEVGRRSNVPVKPGMNVDKEYDMQPPDGCVGWSFSLESMGERVVNSLPPNALKDAEERGKQSVRQGNEALKMLAIGAVGMLATIVFLAFVYKILGSLFGGGGGGGVLEGGLLLLGAPGARDALLKRLIQFTKYIEQNTTDLPDGVTDDGRWSDD
jgi:hypothetical protein